MLQITNFNNIILHADSYKVSHWKQYPEGTTKVFSYIESRGGKYDEVVVAGVQACVKKYLTTPITRQDIDEADAYWTAHGVEFNRAGWEHVLNVHGGRLPIVIKAVPEGTIVPFKNVLLTIENTDPNCFWLTSFVETILLRGVWYGSTVASRAHKMKTVIKHYLEKTGTPEAIAFKLHDFGMRGVSSGESAEISGTAHLMVGFMGTDNSEGILGAMKYYNQKTMPAFSVNASEHSTMTILGKEGEMKQISRMLTEFAKPNKIVSMVLDGYDIFNAVRELGTTFKQQIIESGAAAIVIRPDSGDPIAVNLQLLRDLEKYFGSTVNDKGFRVINHNIRLLQGDGIKEEAIQLILSTAMIHGFSADNFATFGCGGYLLQAMDRDTNKWAMKACYAQVDGQDIDVYKDPVTDPGKTSKKGRITLVIDGNGKYVTRRVNEVRETDLEVMREIFRDGELLIEEDLDRIRSRYSTFEHVWHAKASLTDLVDNKKDFAVA
jgi:nicotinamide phosphoribosyltransferase